MPHLATALSGENSHGLNEHLHFERIGSTGRPVLVLLHGFLSSRLQWTPNVERLSGAFDLVLAELWGHGDSPVPRDQDAYRVARYVAELERIREQIGVAQWLLCGQSFSAGIAIRYALACPGQTSALILTNSRSAFHDVATEGAAAMSLADWERLDLRALALHPCRARRIPGALRLRMENAADSTSRHALWRCVSTTAAELSCRDVLAQLAVPVLLINGRFEKDFQPDRDFAASTIPGIDVADLDAGHAVNIEAAREFDRAVLRFAPDVSARERRPRPAGRKTSPISTKKPQS